MEETAENGERALQRLRPEEDDRNHEGAERQSPADERAGNCREPVADELQPSAIDPVVPRPPLPLVLQQPGGFEHLEVPRRRWPGR